MRRLRKWDERFRTKNNRDRNLKQALGEINRMASALGCPDPIRETASVLYRQALEKDMLRGRSIEGRATAALYAGSRLENAPRTLDEVAAVSRVDKIEIERTYRYLADELEFEMAPMDPEAYIARFASQLGCPDETERRSRELTQAAVEAGVHSGRNPVGIAASALYAAAKLTNQDVIQDDLAEIVASTGSNAQTVDFDYPPLARWIIETIIDGEAFHDGLRSIGMPERNVFGEELAACSTDPRTGFTRDGCCGTHPNDRGRHELCAVMTDEFLSFSKEQGNDLVTPRPELEFPGLDPGDRWCLCLGRWIEALEATQAKRLPETTVPPVVLEATNEAVLDSVDLETLESHSYDA